MKRSEIFSYRRIRLSRLRDDHSVTENSIVHTTSILNDTLGKCLTQSTHIDSPKSKIITDNQRKNYALLAITSSWNIAMGTKSQGRDDSDEHDPGDGNEDDSDDSEEYDSSETEDHSESISYQVIFTFPYSISNGSILNQTVFITDPIKNHLIASVTLICINGSSFIINYSTNQPLPHNVCLFLLLNITSPATIREIFTCQVINANSSADYEHAVEGHAAGPSAVFIIAQGIMIFIMMMIICLAQVFKEKHVVNRFGQHLHRMQMPRAVLNGIIQDPNGMPRNMRSPSIQDQVLAANDLTTTTPGTNRPDQALININELTNRMNT
ncbi:unnamed protein product [Adineta steineri]|uniref:Uncharacterized protein n=1 Tax=Adineta steineri TaxID=433720 RepID=A0A814F7B4_9BILA|nr:unnamed protein product [Adineta steineri]CAF1364426.1 unnamed protein product [Adineta steineri]